jgi:hypothetical protein
VAAGYEQRMKSQKLNASQVYTRWGVRLPELHILRGRLDGGIRNKAARGELRRALPVGLVWRERG